MEERDVRGVYSHPPATGGIRVSGVVAGDVGDAIRIDDLRGIKIPYYDGNPSNLDDFILDWEDFAEEVVGEMRGAPRDKWVCRTFPHRLAQDLKEELRDMILRCRQIPKFSCRTIAETAAVAIFPPPQAFLAHFARFVPILCAVKQI